MRLFLAGDVMTGRGIDQILPFPGDPRLHESFVTSAATYVDLAERANGPVPDGAPFAYVWGDLLADLDQRGCDLRLVNLETAITTADAPAPKAVNYRMAPRNAPVLTAARIDVCTLANNHVLDWGVSGLIETLDTLDGIGVRRVGAGRSAQEAVSALPVAVPPGGVRCAAFAHGSSGVPPDWAAGPGRPGVALLPEAPEALVAALRAAGIGPRGAGDGLALLSVHWGGNWGYAVPDLQRRMARTAIDECGVDLVFGHSSHHPKGIELYRGRLIVYGAGDLINDYEGIAGHEEFRPDLGLAYIVDLDPASGRLAALEMIPYRRRALSLVRADARATAWLAAMLRRESALGAQDIALTQDGTLRLAIAGPQGPRPDG